MTFLKGFFFSLILSPTPATAGRLSGGEGVITVMSG